MSVSGNAERRAAYLRNADNRQTSFVLASARKPKRDGALFEWFVVAGLPLNHNVEIKDPNTIVKVRPQVLYSYPSDPPLAHASDVARFCFPHDVPVLRLSDQYQVQQVWFGSTTELEDPTNSFVFLIQNNESLLYGCCVHAKELLNQESEFVGVLPDEVRATAQYDVVTKRCYCLLSRFPFFHLHFEFLYSLLAKEKLERVTNCDIGSLKSKKPHFPAPGTGPLASLLASFHQLGVPRAGEALSFKLPGEPRALTFTCPPEDEYTQLFEWCLDPMFRLLALDWIVELFNAIIMERQVVIVCKTYGHLSRIVISLVGMVMPFVWQGMMIPIVPSFLMDTLDAPVPFILGVVELPEKKLRELQDVMIINVDTNQVYMPQTPLEDLPDKSVLFNNLLPLYTAIQSKAKPGRNGPILVTYECPPEDRHLLQEVAGVFKFYQQRILNHMTAILPEDFDLRDDARIKEILRKDSKGTEEFFTKLFGTQHFVVYSEKLRQKIQERHKEEKEKAQKSGITQALFSAFSNFKL